MSDDDAKRRFRHAVLDEFRLAVGLRPLAEQLKLMGFAPLGGFEPSEADRSAARALISQRCGKIIPSSSDPVEMILRETSKLDGS